MESNRSFLLFRSHDTAVTSWDILRLLDANKIEVYRVVSPKTPSVEWDDKKSRMWINGKHVQAAVQPTRVLDGAIRLDALADTYAERLTARLPPLPTPARAKFGCGFFMGAFLVTAGMWIYKETA